MGKRRSKRKNDKRRGDKEIKGKENDGDNEKKIKEEIKIEEKEIKGKWKNKVYKCKGEAIDQTPPAYNLKVKTPQGFDFKNQFLILSKNQFLHKKILCFIFINLILLQL